jgi:ABC-type multidrug transport system fused ATPase/permease subunit
MADQEINIKLNGIAQIRSELKALKGELANATDPKQMADLAERAGELSDKLKDANERAAVFASGSRFEQTSNAFGLMSSQLMSMDFEGASESAKLFAGNLGKIDGKTISSGLKGLGSTVASVGGAFLKLGAQLLINPIFLLVAVVAAIVAGLYMLAERLGFVTKFVDFLTAAFKPLIDMVKWFLDLIGLTSFAADEALAKTTAALEEEKEKRQEVLGQMDQKIALLDAEGKSTLALRIERNKYMQEEINNNLKLLEVMDNAFLNQTKLYKDTVKENKAKAQEIKVEEVKLNQEVIAEGQKAAEAQKQFLADRLAATRLIEDLRVGVMQDGIEKELEANRLKYARLQEDTLKNEKYNEQERIALNALYVKEADQTAKDINKKYVDAEAKKQEELAAKRKEEQDKIIEQEDALFAMRQALTQTEQERAIAQIVAESEAKLGMAGITAADEILIAQDTANKIADIEKAARDKKAEEEKAEFERKMKMAEDYANSVNNLAETAFTISNRFGKQDEESKEKRAKRQFQVAKALQLSMAIMDGYKSITAFFASNSLTVAGIPNPGAIASFALTLSSVVANVAKIASTQYGAKNGNPAGGGGGAGMGGGGGTANAGGGAPSFSLFGQGNNMNTTGGPKDAENKSNQLTVKAVVVESDVTSTQNKVKKMQENATL